MNILYLKKNHIKSKLLIKLYLTVKPREYTASRFQIHTTNIKHCFLIKYTTKKDDKTPVHFFE